MDLSAKALSDIEGLATQLQKTLTEHAPQAWEIAKEVVRVDAAANILGIVVAIIVSVGFIIGLRVSYKWFKATEEYDNFVPVAATTLTAIGSVIMPIIAINLALNVWSWIGLFMPEIVIAHDAMQKVLGQ
jgi:uncharacterized protein YneF (UPF0154 family)